MQTVTEIDTTLKSFSQALADLEIAQAISIGENLSSSDLQILIRQFLELKNNVALVSDAIEKSKLSLQQKKIFIVKLLTFLAQAYDEKNRKFVKEINQTLKYKCCSDEILVLFRKFSKQARIFEAALTNNFREVSNIITEFSMDFLFDFYFDFCDVKCNFSLIHCIANTYKIQEKSVLALLKAIIEQNPTICLSKKATYDLTPLALAFSNGNYKIVEFLNAQLKSQNELSQLLWQTIARTTNEVEDLNKIKFLLNLGANINHSENQQSILFITLSYTHDKIFQIIKKNKQLDVRNDPNKIQLLRQAYLIGKFEYADFLIPHFTDNEINDLKMAIKAQPIHQAPPLDSPNFKQYFKNNEKIESHVKKAQQSAAHNSAGILSRGFFKNIKSRLQESNDVVTDAVEESEIEIKALV